MADETSLLPVVVGGLLTMGGGVVGFIGSAIRDFMRERKERARRRADKFEELVGAVYELDHWLDKQRDISFGTIEDTLGVSPFAKLQAISAVHFPTLDPLIKALQTGVAKYTLWNAKTLVSRIAGELRSLPPDYQEAIKPYTDARDSLLETLTKLAHTEFE
jgi:hypothetical protein